MKIVLDIETVQHSKEEWAALKGVGLLAADDLLNAGDAAEQDREYEKSCFDPTFCRIVCIGALFFTDTMEPQEATAWYGSNEKELLRQFWERMKIVRPTLFVTHNGLRSEERRVGKDGRYWCTPYHDKKNKATKNGSAR